MLAIISPAKSLNFESHTPSIQPTTPIFVDEIQELNNHFKKLSARDLEKLMKISPKLAELNFQRFQNFSTNFTKDNSRPALFFFDGDVYKSMEIDKYDVKDLEFAQNHLRILSGLYGILRAVDSTQAYRLEMGTNCKAIMNQNLPNFWKNKIASFLNEELESQQERTIINLASEEYSSAIDNKLINGKIINIIFKENKDGIFKTVGIMAKRARGLMANFIIKNKIEKSIDLKGFNAGNYKFKEEFSNQDNWHFHR